jgi:magnesium transporter
MNSKQIKDLSRPVRDFALPVETTLLVGQTAQEAMASLRKRQIEHKIVYFYVIDDQQRLVGVVSARRLLLADPADSVTAIMDSPAISVAASMTLEEAMEMFAMHRLLAFPVVETDGRLIGHIDIDLYADEAVDVSESQRSAELFQLIGVSVAGMKLSSPMTGFYLRMPWLLCNIAGGLACAAIVGYFHAMLAEVILLAMFIPLVLTLSEAISMQSMTLSLQQLRSRRAAWSSLWKRMSLEWKTTCLVGLCAGAIVSIAAALWGQSRPAAVIGVCIAISMAAAATVGAVVPMLLHMMRMDPKVAAGPVVLMIGDVITTALYLTLAAWWLV